MKSYTQNSQSLYRTVTCSKCGAVDEILAILSGYPCYQCGEILVDKAAEKDDTNNPAQCPQTSTREVKVMSEYPILNNVPIIPRKNLSATRAAKYPFADLQNGQGFFVEGKSSKSFGSAVSNAMKRTGHRYIVRSTEDAGSVLENPALNGKSGVIVVRKDS